MKPKKIFSLLALFLPIYCFAVIFAGNFFLKSDSNRRLHRLYPSNFDIDIFYKCTFSSEVRNQNVFSRFLRRIKRVFESKEIAPSSCNSMPVSAFNSIMEIMCHIYLVQDNPNETKIWTDEVIKDDISKIIVIHEIMDFSLLDNFFKGIKETVMQRKFHGKDSKCCLYIFPFNYSPNNSGSEKLFFITVEFNENNVYLTSVIGAYDDAISTSVNYAKRKIKKIFFIEKDQEISYKDYKIPYLTDKNINDSARFMLVAALALIKGLDLNMLTFDNYRDGLNYLLSYNETEISIQQK